MNRILPAILVFVLLGLHGTRGTTAPLPWTQLPAIPNPFGLGGPNAGIHNGALIVAGGANFPSGPPWKVGDQPSGSKVWHEAIYVLEQGDTTWRDGFKLPRPLAYAATVSTDEGIYLLGGETFEKSPVSVSGDTVTANHPTANVILLSWDANTKQLQVTDNALPPLPRACQYHRAVILDRVIYVTASHARSPRSQMLDVISFWALDLDQRPRKRRWKQLPPWPGPAREKMALAVQDVNIDGTLTSCLFMISGATWMKDRHGKMDLTRFRFFTDAYRYHPGTNQWQVMASLPVLKDTRDIDLSRYRFNSLNKSWVPLAPGKQEEHDINQLFANQPTPLAASTAIAAGPSHVLLFSGATGRYITMKLSECPTFPRDVLAYDTHRNRWTRLGEMPAAVVTTKAVRWGDLIVIPSGEIRPGIRTRQVQGLPIHPAVESLKR